MHACGLTLLAATDLSTGERLSYRAFDKRVNTVARRLAGLVSPAGQRIAAVARNCIEMALLSAACERAGAVFTPLNWRLSTVELADIITDCAPGYDSHKALIIVTDHGRTDRATRIPAPNESGNCRCFFAANGGQIALQRGDNRSSGPLFRRAQN
jgi:acyl-CoA synthetase (AMP-forming)/AMP-acid ligase II